MDSTPNIAARKPCFGAKLCTELKRMVMLALFVGLLAIAGKYYCFDRLNEEIRARVESLLREHYRGLTVSVPPPRRGRGSGGENPRHPNRQSGRGNRAGLRKIH